MRIRGVVLVLILTLTAIVSAIIPVSAAVSVRSTDPGAAMPNPQGLILPGGLRAKPANGSLSPHRMPNAPQSIIDYGPVYIVNASQDTFAITVQPWDSNGRLANHLYMWTNSNYNTQQFDELYDTSNRTYIWKSVYNGLCINVPQSTSSSGIQLIVYSCNGYPANERFSLSPGPINGCNTFCHLLEASYNTSVSIAIGNGFPVPTGNGAWVITYGSNNQNWKEQWYWY
jgi:hypothetical protein